MLWWPTPGHRIHSASLVWVRVCDLYFRRFQHNTHNIHQNKRGHVFPLPEHCRVRHLAVVFTTPFLCHLSAKVSLLSLLFGKFNKNVKFVANVYSFFKVLSLRKVLRTLATKECTRNKQKVIQRDKWRVSRQPWRWRALSLQLSSRSPVPVPSNEKRKSNSNLFYKIFQYITNPFHVDVFSRH